MRSAETSTDLDARAIQAFEDALIEGMPALEGETQEGLVTRALASKGAIAFSFSIHSNGLKQSWSRTYGVRRNAKGLAEAAACDPDKVLVPIPSFCSSEAEAAEWREYQLDVRKGVLEQAIADSDESVGAGFAGASVPVSRTTSFQIQSISKAIAGVAAMRLVQRGLIDLDMNIDHALKKAGFDLDSKLPHGCDTVVNITLRMLFGHAAGISGWGYDGYNRQKVLDGSLAIPTTLGVVSGDGNSAKLVLESIPDFVAVYSGGSFTLAQLVLETITGKPLADILHEEVVLPLGLQHTFTDTKGNMNAGNFVCGHVGMEGLPLPGGFKVYPETAAAGIWSTAEDLCVLGDALFHSFHGLTEGGEPFLRRDLAREMMEPRYPLTATVSLGVGWEIRQLAGAEGQAEFAFGHSGWGEGFRSDMQWCGLAGCGFAWVLSGMDDTDLVERAVKAVKKVYGFPEAVVPSSAAPGDQAPASLDACVGTYFSMHNVLQKRGEAGNIRVERGKGGSLRFGFSSIAGTGLEVDPVDGETFSFKVFPRLEARFFVNERGVVCMKFGNFQFERKLEPVPSE
ncbi:beta-lactamase/transpeptidase-like protein [Chytriomyces sp. MP71]|nr:beta-lactamase/transpeptidase-like protein [Chytriomyces sp. MP71]